MSDLDFFTETIDIKRKTTTNTKGSISGAYSVVKTGVKASIQSIKLQDVVRAGRVINSAAFTCYLDISTDILGDDHIAYLDEKYNIISMQKYSNNYIKIHMEKII